ncbi:hypothetical protein [Mesorhizobium sp. WSM4313]|uniref:hypothetical protein n=1 Tax=Mesorhizobium sp. WSM4313 TaxID=2029412 RepID=UPI000BB088FF|nr:hypothetical protein [Mesorhizobium sp. WSM4313]PBB19294.1 hypothetical protein CK219_14455 [Mesorhizobium sp. WSM4313]
MPIATIEIHDHDGDRPFAASDAPSSSEVASETLDSGDTNAFSSLEAGAIACGRDLRPHEQGQIVASR